MRRTSKRRAQRQKITFDDLDLDFVQEDSQSGRQTRSKERLGQPGERSDGRRVRKIARIAETNPVK